MGAATTSDPIPPLSNVDAAGASPLQRRDDPLQLPDRLPVQDIAQRRISKAGGFGSPVRRSPRLSRLLPPRPPVHCQDTQDSGESSDDESECVNESTPHIPRGETPESDALPDEPSTILANKIIRAHDNPSPPPQDPGINYVPGKDGYFPGVSPPPSPFRPINLLERLDQLACLPFDSSSSLRTPSLDDRPEFDIVSPRDSILLESCSQSVTSIPSKRVPYGDLASADTIPSSSTQYTADDPPRSSQHVREPANIVDGAEINPSFQPVAGLHGQLITATRSPDSEVFISSRTQAADPSLNPLVPPAPDGRSPRSGRQSCRQSLPLVHNAETISSPQPNETGNGSPASEMTVPGEQDDDGKETLSTDQNSVSVSREEQCRMTSTKGVNANLYRRLDSLSPRSSDVLVGLCLPSESTSSIEQTALPADSIPIQHPPVTPSRTPKSSVTHPDFSRTTVQRPVIAPTPVRANNGSRKLNSPSKEVSEVYRTPAQRVPIETALARGTCSLKRTVQISIGSNQHQPGRFPNIKAPVFTRSALDDPSRSPAKRIPVTDLVASPTRGDPAPGSPTRLDLRARSASVEPRPLRSIPACSRSVEPRTVNSKPDNHGEVKDSIFPMVPMLPRSGTKLPFPLVPSQKSSIDLPPSIPEERKTVETGNPEADALLGRVTQTNTMPQLRQPSVNSRIPRIGSKPYARPPPKNGKATADTTTANMALAPQRAPPFQLAYKNNGVGNSDTEVFYSQPTNDQHLVGSLKRKRGIEATAPSKSVMIRQVVPGILSGKYAPKPAKFPSHAQLPPGSSPPKVPQPLKFRKVIDGMLSARYPPAKANLAQPELSGSSSQPLSPLSELSSSSNEGHSDEKLPPVPQHPAHSEGETSDISRTDGDASVVEPSTHKHSSLHQDASGDETTSRPRRTSRTRKPAQQQYVLDVFSGNTSTRPPPVRRKPQPRMEGDGFMGMSATALRALTVSNTTKNQQTVAVLATEVIRKEGLRPESPMVKARTILQKQRDERDLRRRERTQRRARMSEESLGANDTEGQAERRERVSVGARADHDENDCAMPPRHCWSPGDEEDHETRERPGRLVEPLRLEGAGTKVKPVKQVKWHRGLSTAVYLDEVDPRPKPLSKDAVVVRGCLAPTSKDLPLDPLGNLVHIENQPSPELVTERIVVKKYLYDNDIEPEPIPTKMTRSKGKKGRS